MIKSWSSVQQNVEVIIGSSVPSLDAWAWVRIPCHHQSPRLVDLSASVWSFFLRKAKYCCTWFISYFTLTTSTKLHTSVMVFKCSKCTRGKSISEPHSTDFVIGKFTHLPINSRIAEFSEFRVLRVQSMLIST